MTDSSEDNLRDTGAPLETEPDHGTIVDVDEAAARFAAAGIACRFTRVADLGEFSLSFRATRFGSSALIRTQWGTDNWTKVEIQDSVAVIVDAGEGAPSQFTVSGDEVPASSRESPIIQPGQDIEVFRPADSPVYVLSAATRDLERLARDIAGTDAGHVEFQTGYRRDSATGQRFERLVRFAFEELRDNPEAIEHPIVRRQLDELVLGGILSLPGDHHRMIERSTAAIAPAVVRRAEEYMEANLARAISIADVAAACGCSRTKLFDAFKKGRHCTPLQFLVRRRMERARQRLLSAQTGITVTRVSLDCGYANFSRFAHEYRKLYGETPSTTLKRSRGPEHGVNLEAPSVRSLVAGP